MLYYPAVLHAADTDGIFGCEGPDLFINASGRDADEALKDAAIILTELLSTMPERREPFPESSPIEDIELDGGALVYLTAHHPRAVA